MQAERSKKGPGQDSEDGARREGGFVGRIRTTPPVAYEILLSFPFLDLWIRKMDWELVEQLGIQAQVVLDHCSRRCFFEKSYTVAIGV